MKRFSIFLCICLIQPSWSAVTFDAVGTVTDNVAVVTSSNTSLTVGVGSNRALIAQVCWSGTVGAPNAHWDTTATNQNMPLISSGTTTTSSQACALFGLVAPTSGNKTFNVTWTTSRECIGQIVSWTGVDQTGGNTSFKPATNAQGTTNKPIITITSAVGNMTVDAIANGTSFGMTAVSATQTYLQSGTGAIESGGSRNGGNWVTVISTANLAGSDPWIAIGTDLVASGGGAAATVYPSGRLLGVGVFE